MVVTLAQQYNVREKPTVILYTYINSMQGHKKTLNKQKHCSMYTTTKTNQKQCNTSLYRVVILYDYCAIVLLLFLICSVLVANPKKLLYTVANPSPGLLNRGKRSSSSIHTILYKGIDITCRNRTMKCIIPCYHQRT